MQLKPVGLILLACLFLIAVTSASYFGYNLAKSDTQKALDQIAQITIIPTPNSLPDSIPELEPSITPSLTFVPNKFEKTAPVDSQTILNDTYTWLTKPKLETNDQRLKDLLQFSPSPTNDYIVLQLSSLKFLELGSGQKVGKVYLVYFYPEGPSFSTPHFVFIPKHNTIVGNYGATNEYLKGTAFLETRFKKEFIPDLFFPTTIVSKGETITMVNPSFASEYSYPTEVVSKSIDKVLDQQNGLAIIGRYSTYDETNKSLQSRTILVKNKAGFLSSPYQVKAGMLNDDRSPNFTPSSGYALPKKLEPVVQGCGVFYADNIAILDNTVSKQIIGTWQSQSLYALTDINNPVFQKIYSDYSQAKQYNPSPAPAVSKEQFVKLPSHILWQDNFGDWRFLVNEEYQVQAECGKPVIYLYPEKPTEISVQVGADITVSEPTYSAGWKNVLAQPSGQLSYQGQTYPNLFWEGTGHGPYPQDTHSRGIIVPSSQAVSTITKQLLAQGLNSQEIADFLDFWQPKLPTKNYVRLTWLSKSELDTLAPLYVNPKPTSSIRVFLEFEELSNPYILVPQSLTKPTRTGYTLVEWGGLLIKN